MFKTFFFLNILTQVGGKPRCETWRFTAFPEQRIRQEIAYSVNATDVWNTLSNRDSSLT